MELWGRHFETGRAVCLHLDGDRVARCTAVDGVRDTGPGDSARWPWLAPALIDLQLNGYAGQEFASADLTPQKVHAIVEVLDRFGVARFCPTLTTESRAVLCHALAAIDAFCNESPALARRVAAIHVEGPYITADDGARGAHPRQHCRPPDWDEFQQLQDAAGGRIGILTMSPEYEAALPFIERVADSGVVVSIGHTSAAPAQIRRAVDAGARMSTHLGNGSHLSLPQPENYIWEQMADDRLVAGMIADGHHLPPEVVKVIVRVKSPQRCVLVSDISGQAGQPPGRYTSPFCDLEILPSGRLVVAGQREILAGASLPLGAGVANVVRFAGVTLSCAIRMAVHHPAAVLGIEHGGLEPGSAADLIQFRLEPAGEHPESAGFRLLSTVIGGRLAWGAPWRPT